MKKAITFLLIGILIGTFLGSYLFKEVEAELDEIYYLKEICDSLNSIESDLDSINLKLGRILCSVNWIKYWIKYCVEQCIDDFKKELGVYNEH